MAKFLPLLLICFLLLGATEIEIGFAQQPLDGREHIFHDELLDNLLGEWKVTRKFKTRTAENMAKAEWVLNHQFMLIKMKDVGEMREAFKLMFAAAITLSAAVGVTVACDTSSQLGNDGASLVGNWTGESICVGPFPACHDEKVIYRIPKAPDETGKVTITADKIVNGKPETMGVLDFTYDGKKGTLVCEFTRGNTHGLWEFKVKEDTMEGTLVVLPDKTLARRVKLKKEAPTSPAFVNDR